MARPALMLLDEPSIGLSPKLVEVIAETLQRLRADGIAMLLVEQNAMLTFAATSHCLVLENGEIALTGPLRRPPRQPPHPPPLPGPVIQRWFSDIVGRIPRDSGSVSHFVTATMAPAP
jgi:energy-coupling factor transporter ATP-binding protein EcfA2